MSETTTTPIRVLLVDDHAMIRTGFRTILDAQPDITVVGEASSGAEAIASARSLQPDVITMDVQMPDMDGITATRHLAEDPTTQAAIAIVTTFDRDDYLFTALDAGASGFLLKNAGPEDLVTAVRVLAAGDGMLAPEVTRRVLDRFASPQDGGDVAPRPALQLTEPLTEREDEVLRLMAEALSNSEIAARLYIGEATVKTHVSRVLQKLAARDRVQAVVIALRHGLA
jgi:DNA-binding NarL/FixJ family response regulator